MLARYKHFDTILLPLNAADPSYLSFETQVLEEARKQNLGIQGMKSLANAKLLQSFSVKECLTYVLSLPIHCLAVGCTTIGQLEDDVRIAEQLELYSEQEMAQMRERAQDLSGPWLGRLETRHSGGAIALRIITLTATLCSKSSALSLSLWPPRNVEPLKEE